MAFFQMGPQLVFDIFPEEIWLMIIENLEDGKDIHNLLLASNDLHERFQEKTDVWLFDQVFPHIFKYTQDVEPMKTCRRWRRSINAFLEGHPSRYPYNSEGLTRRSVPYGDFTYLSINESFTNCFTSIEQMNTFIEECQDHGGNPIIGRRCVKFENLSDATVQTFLNSTISFMQIFGEHIFFLDLKFEELSCRSIPDCKRNIRNVLRCFALAPNLRSLKIHVTFVEHNVVGYILEKGRIQFPALPHLESLEIHELTVSGFNEALVRAYSGPNTSLGKLQTMIPENEFAKGTFQNISELCYHNDANQDILDILRDWPCLKIRKLKLYSMCRGELSILNLFNILATFAIEELDIMDCQIVDEETDNLPQLPTVKYFGVADDFSNNLDYIKMLTSLEHLRVDWPVNNRHGLVGDDDIQMPSENCVSVSEFTADLRKCLYSPFNLGKVKIWDELKGVKIITVAGNGDVRLYQFAREYGNRAFPLKW